MFNSMLALTHVDSADWCHAFAHGLTGAFHRLGLPAAMVTFTGENQDDMTEAYRRLLAEGGPPFLFDINGKIGTDNAPKFTWVVDHPLLHPRLAETGRRTVLGLIDSGHALLTGYTPSPTTFLPHGGPEPDERQIPWAERDIDVLFVGNVFPQQHSLDPLEQLACQAGTQAGAEGADPFAALVAALATIGRPLDSFNRNDVEHLLSIATQEAHRYERVHALTALKSVRLHVAGTLFGDWPARLGASTTLHGAVKSFAAVCGLMRRSRVVLNLSAKFPHGSHERIWHAMACGAAVVTNRSTFVEQDFEQGRHIFYYQRPDEIGALVDAALSNGAGARTAEAARPIYAAGHTWDDRAARILSAMNRLTPP